MSSETPPLDVAAAHRHFSAECFNRTWTLIEKPDRTPAEDSDMVLCASASLWHWTQRADCTDRHRSVGHWLLARVFALIGQGENAMEHAQKCLACARDLPPFYIGYGHEAVARAALILGNPRVFQTHLNAANACAAGLPTGSEREQLERDVRALAEVIHLPTNTPPSGG